MPGRGNLRFLTGLSSFPTFIGATQATVPPNLGSDATANITVPIHASAMIGDNLYAIIKGTTAHTSPADWTQLGGATPNGAKLWYRQHDGSATYTWNNVTANLPRSGCMIAVRGGVTGNIATTNHGFGIAPWTVASVQAGPTANALWLGFLANEANDNANDVSAVGATLQVEHCGNGTAMYLSPAVTAIALVSGLTESETVSGKQFNETIPGVGPTQTFGLIVNPF